MQTASYGGFGACQLLCHRALRHLSPSPHCRPKTPLTLTASIINPSYGVSCEALS